MFCRLIALTTFIIASVHTQENPAVFDGKGMIIDLGIDVTTHDWQKDGEVWTSHGAFKDHPAVADTQRAALFIEEVHHNLAAAFFFTGKSHRVTNTIIHHQAKSFAVGEDAQLSQSGNEWRRE